MVPLENLGRITNRKKPELKATTEKADGVSASIVLIDISHRMYATYFCVLVGSRIIKSCSKVLISGRKCINFKGDFSLPTHQPHSCRFEIVFCIWLPLLILKRDITPRLRAIEMLYFRPDVCLILPTRGRMTPVFKHCFRVTEKGEGRHRRTRQCRPSLPTVARAAADMIRTSPYQRACNSAVA